MTRGSAVQFSNRTVWLSFVPGSNFTGHGATRQSDRMTRGENIKDSSLKIRADQCQSVATYSSPFRHQQNWSGGCAMSSEPLFQWPRI
ncbi:MAG: hypothetical protein JWP89_2103 [Schlesneria sp.]|nr:hypothetical protein [Schlesneria sp.]